MNSYKTYFRIRKFSNSRIFKSLLTWLSWSWVELMIILWRASCLSKKSTRFFKNLFSSSNLAKRSKITQRFSSGSLGSYKNILEVKRSSLCYKIFLKQFTLLRHRQIAKWNSTSLLFFLSFNFVFLTEFSFLLF